MTRVGIIGGTGAGLLVPAGVRTLPAADTRWGLPSGPCLSWQQAGVEVVYLPRHGADGAVAPHRVNYRANIQVMRDLGCDAVVGVNAVGGITAGAWPGRLVLPDQLIDYTWGREHTFFDGIEQPLQHVEFDPPFSELLRERLITAGKDLDVLGRATYGVTQGPRLETAAEIDRLAADGCEIVGMTAMPEAGLAREAGLTYAICAVVVNRAAGRLAPGGSIHADLRAHVSAGMANVSSLLGQFLAGL